VSLGGVVAQALARRAPLLTALNAEGTDCVRLVHGIAEGAPGLAVDRYGPVLLVQTWRAPLLAAELDAVVRAVDAVVPGLTPVWNHRGEGEGGGGTPPAAPIGRELGLAYDVRPRHRGQDPLLFLDFRAARRWVKAHAAGREVLNLFAYTCGIGVAAAAGGASCVVNVDFARSALEVGRANAARSGVPTERFETLHGDALVVARQLAGLPAQGRRGQKPPAPLAARSFDLVVLDPPRWAKSAFGAVDVVRDYPSLFKPALLATRPGGVVLAANHVPSVDKAAWYAVLRRTAEKAGRPLETIEDLPVEADFPSFDGAPPLKLAICRLGRPSA
jgi:23S rRNA (cytosine1962-C5)-methyltransferase